MAEDDLLERIGGSWRSQPHDASKMLRRLKRERWIPRLLLATEVAAMALAFSVGLWFANLAMRTDDLSLGLAAAALLIAAPTVTVATVLLRRSSLAWEDETPDSVLRVGLRRADASLAAIRLGRWQLMFLAGFLALLWGAQLLGWIDEAPFLLFYSAVCAVTGPAIWLWLHFREEGVRTEREACLLLAGELRGEIVATE